MSNPLNTFFGPSVVFLLRHRPEALRRIAERVKPLLMAAVHPDKNHDDSSEIAKEVSEAYQALLAIPPEELGDMIEGFLAEQRGREKDLKTTLRQLREANTRLTQASKDKDRKIKIFGDKALSEQERLFSWMLSERGLTSRLTPKGAVPRGLLHQYRIVVVHEQGRAGQYFRGHEFDELGRSRRTLKSNSLDMASGRVPMKRSDDSYTELSSVKEGQTLLGTTTGIPEGVKLEQAVKEGLVQPFVALDRHLVFCWVYRLLDRRTLIQDLVGGRVVEIIPL